MCTELTLQRDGGGQENTHKLKGTPAYKGNHACRASAVSGENGGLPAGRKGSRAPGSAVSLLQSRESGEERIWQGARAAGA